MNRREAIAGSAALAVGAVFPGTNLSAEQDLSLGKSDNRVRYHTTSIIFDDPDVDQIEMTIRLKEGKTIAGSDSFLMERVVLKHVVPGFLPWFKYCRDNGMKTF